MRLDSLSSQNSISKNIIKEAVQKNNSSVDTQQESKFCPDLENINKKEEKINIKGLPGKPVKIPDNISDIFKQIDPITLVDKTLSKIKNGDKADAILAMEKFENDLNKLDEKELKIARDHIINLLSKDHDNETGKILKAMFYMVEKEIDSRPDIKNFPWPSHPHIPLPPHLPDFPKCPLDNEIIKKLDNLSNDKTKELNSKIKELTHTQPKEINTQTSIVNKWHEYLYEEVIKQKSSQ